MIVLMPVLAAVVMVTTPAPERATDAAVVTVAVEVPLLETECHAPVRSSWH